MSRMKSIASSVGALLVFASMAVGFDRSTDFINITVASASGDTVEPPNVTSNKGTTDPDNGGKGGK